MIDKDRVRENLLAMEREVRRRRYLKDPVAWTEEVLGNFIWSKQKQILNSIRDNRRTAVKSCHAAGKSFIAARAAAWWLAVHPPGSARVVTTAPTGHQVKAVLWTEIAHAFTAGALPGRLNQTEWYMTVEGGREEMVGFGRKPADMDVAAFQGIHAPFVLLILDEACGIPKGLWDAGDSIISNEDSRQLAIGNPENPATEFYEVCKPGSGHNVIKIAAADTPAFTGEVVPPVVLKQLISPVWVEEKRKSWGENNPQFIGRILAEFPETANDGLFPMAWLQQAMSVDLTPTQPSEMGVDVGGGGDKTVIAFRQGPVVRIIKESVEPNTMSSLGMLQGLMAEFKCPFAKVDEIGIGRGIVDRAEELDLPITGINVGQKAVEDKAYVNYRAECYWQLRELFEKGLIDIDPKDDELAAQLLSIQYRRISQGGRIQIESKDEMKRRGLSSPDRADAVMLAFAAAKRPKKGNRITWGKRNVGGSGGRGRRR